MRAGASKGSGERRARARSRAVVRLLMLCCLAVAGLLAWSAPALALGQRGHHFGFAFDQEGGAKAVAVNESLSEGNVYVGSGEQVKRFTCTPTGCTPLTGEHSSFKPKEGSPESIAVDNSGGPSQGNVYVATEEKIYRFNAEGEKLGEPIVGYKEPGEAKEEFGEIHGIAVDANGNLWVYHEESVTEFDDDNTPPRNKFVKHTELFLSCFATPGFAVGPQGEFLYVGEERENRGEECEEAFSVIAKLGPEGEPFNKGVDRENTLSAAVDLANGNVYLGNVDTIAAFQSDGSFIQRFGAGEVSRARGIAVNSKTNEVYVADFTPENLAADRVEVFEPEPAGAPAVDSISSQNLSPTSARLSAAVDPNGADTQVHFEYGTGNCAEGAPCTSTATQDIGSGFGDQQVSAEVTGLQPGTKYFYRAVAGNDCGSGGSCSAERSGILDTLPASSGLLADNRAWELVSPPEKSGYGIEAIGGVAQNGAPSGGVMQAAEDGSGITYVADGPVVPEPEGNRAPEGTQVLSSRSAQGWSSQDIVTPQNRTEGLPAGEPQEYRFFSADLSAAIVEPLGIRTLQEPPLVPGVGSEERSIYLRRNATCGTAPATCYEPLVSAANDTTNEKFAGLLEFVDATPDLSHAIVESQVPLTPDAPESGGLYEWRSGQPLELVSVLPGGTAASGATLGWSNGTQRNTRHALSSDGSRVVFGNEEGNRLYVRDTTSNETVQVNAAVPPLPEPKEDEPELDETHFQIASSDGSRVFFTDTAPLTADSTLKPTIGSGPADLYEFDVNTRTLTDLTAQSSGGNADVQGFVLGASEDGSSAYFVANGILAEGADLGTCAQGVPAETCNLYVAHLEGGKWSNRFIAELSIEDGHDWLASFEAKLGGLTSRVSPNGEFLAFMSNRPITGYENVDANPEAHGARDEEVFLYDAAAHHVACASCRTGFAPQGVFDTEQASEGNGLLVDRPGNWDGRWLAGSIPGWTPLNLYKAAQQSRYLSDEGRLFFNSPEELVKLPAEEQYVHKENVYEYEPAGVGSCDKTSGCVSLLSSGVSNQESAFIDATPSGDNAFFITAQQLVPADRDHSFDLYDARVCTDASPCIAPTSPPAPPCSSEASCRPPGSLAPGFGAPASATQAGGGNVTKLETRGETKSKGHKLTRAQLLAKALKSCRHKHKGKSKHAKKKRVACERQARKKYGPKKSTKHAKKSAKAANGRTR
jgi:DNA-binding beta-propeller fold protein YncE